MTHSPQVYCSVCERWIREDAREDIRGVGWVFLCSACAAKPTLLAAFREGRARLAGEGAG